MLVRGPSDLSELRAKLPVPEGLSGTWAAARLDHPGRFDFGPATIEVVIWIPVGDDDPLGRPGQTWDDIERVLGPAGDPVTVSMSQLAVAALVPDRLDEMRTGNGTVEITGPAYRATAFEGGGFALGRAVRIGGGLLAAVTTV